ncbi:MAG: helix-turn-helix transcriptional regulator [Clostridia bacterium]|nr:helix-turn-helix transcriptional regulator [Clostridia bacterium]
MDNICRFVSVNCSPDPVQTINFVYETKNHTVSGAITEPLYKACIVARGKAKICLGGVEKELKRDDIFFILPAVSYTFYDTENFAYMYISFMGIRGNAIMEQIGINRRNFVFEDFPELCETWKKGINYKNEVVDILSEGLLMQTFAAIGNRVLMADNRTKEGAGNRMPEIKKYIDINFSDSDLSLEMLAEKFCYNKNYISSAFKKLFGMGVREYLNMVRVNNACVLMEQNDKSVEEIASLCGYGDRMYFSKVFKEKIGVSPKQYMKNGL